ncbi:putative transmembrane protein [Delftia acidovorans SPH-1]|uniref:Putative transmembrane protein n=1 Tax=Delftia acidovorans (strain DSM 14801 / SPH-1) TaxID=398578 RepID=A9C2D9_DELAS|nr:hypothetical protein [Delftia acidovorans]ABX36083.1 putative transmembrane protein [Delftia acidovorans SPH-1]QPS74631.1 hypothetical protein I6G48_29175 [Delftia acidovorans]
MITLSDGMNTLNLNPDLRWSDEDNWHPVQQSVQRTITGALDIQAAAMDKGRPITLEPEDDSSAWMSSGIVVQLRNWAAVPGQQLILTLRNETRNVVFRHQDGGLEARPVVHYRDRTPTDWYLCVVRLMEI